MFNHNKEIQDLKYTFNQGIEKLLQKLEETSLSLNELNRNNEDLLNLIRDKEYTNNIKLITNNDK